MSKSLLTMLALGFMVGCAPAYKGLRLEGRSRQACFAAPGSEWDRASERSAFGRQATDSLEGSVRAHVLSPKELHLLLPAVPASLASGHAVILAIHLRLPRPPRAERVRLAVRYLSTDRRYSAVNDSNWWATVMEREEPSLLGGLGVMATVGVQLFRGLLWISTLAQADIGPKLPPGTPARAVTPQEVQTALESLLKPECVLQKADECVSYTLWYSPTAVAFGDHVATVTIQHEWGPPFPSVGFGRSYSGEKFLNTQNDPERCFAFSDSDLSLLRDNDSGVVPLTAQR